MFATRVTAARLALAMAVGGLLGAPRIAHAQNSPATAPAAAIAPPVISPAPTTAPADSTTTAVSAVATAPTTSPTATVPTTGPSPSPLIQALSSPDPRDRRHAAAELIKLGEAARPMVEQLLKQTTDLDIVTRAQSILAQLDEDRMIGPSYITLHVKDAPAREVAEALGRQAFAPLRVFPDNLWDDKTIPKVSLDVDHQPFWTVMRQFSTQTGLDLQPYPPDGPRLMRGMGRPSGAEVVVGPFLIVATQISRMQMVQLGPNGGRHSDFSMQMTAFAEPKIIAIQGQGNIGGFDARLRLRIADQGGTVLDVKEAVDDAGNSLVGNAATRRTAFFGGFNGAWQLFAPLNWPQHPGKRIKRIVCDASFTIQTKSQRIQVDNVLTAQGHSQKFGDAQISFNGISKNGGNWELHLTITSANSFYQLIQQRLQLLDADGHPLDRRGMFQNRTGNTDTYRLLFAAGHRNDGSAVGDPSRFIWDLPSESKAVPVRFEFDDLPMPG